MKVDLAHVLEISAQRAFNGAQVLATALLVGFSTIAVAAQTYNIANLSLGGTYGQARSFNATRRSAEYRVASVGTGSLCSVP